MNTGLTVWRLQQYEVSKYNFILPDQTALIQKRSRFDDSLFGHHPARIVPVTRHGVTH